MRFEWSIHKPQVKMTCAPQILSTAQAAYNAPTLIRTVCTFKAFSFNKQYRTKANRTYRRPLLKL